MFPKSENINTEDCPLCLQWDCECEDVLSKVDFERLVNEYKEELK